MCDVIHVCVFVGGGWLHSGHNRVKQGRKLTERRLNVYKFAALHLISQGHISLQSHQNSFSSFVSRQTSNGSLIYLN
jgi:hypothetical protein